MEQYKSLLACHIHVQSLYMYTNSVKISQQSEKQHRIIIFPFATMESRVTSILDIRIG